MEILRLQMALALIFIITSCSNLVVKHDLQSNREIASEINQNNCTSIAKNIISKKAGSDFIDKNTIEPSFSALLGKRIELKEKYDRVIESIKDFNPAGDPAILGKAKLLIDPQEAYLAKIMMIRKAKYTLDISYYIFNDDEAGRALLHEVRSAVKRGVKVRIMFDSLGTRENAPVYTAIQALGLLRGGKIRNMKGELTEERAKVEIAIINPVFNIRKHVANWYARIRNLFVDEGEKFPITTFSPNRRSHDKILMIDANSPQDSTAIIGGRNVTNSYYALSTDEQNFHDVEILLRNVARTTENGTIENTLEDYYNKIFYYAANKNLEHFLFKINNTRAKKQLKKLRAGHFKVFSDKGLNFEPKIKKLEAENFFEKDTEEGMVNIVHELQNFSRVKAFLKPLHSINPKNGASLFGKLEETMKNAKSSIEIVSPYMWLSDNDIEFIKKWLAEDSSRTFKIVTNSISTTDNISAQVLVDSIVGPKLVSALKHSSLREQIKIYSYGKIDDVTMGGNTSYGKLHAKFAIIDNKIILVGTSNFDPRSRYLNTEIGAFFEGRANGYTVSALKNFLEELISKSYEWGSEDWQRVREHRANRTAVSLQYFVTKIVHFFNLVPLF